jgi:hypothetical protein
MGALVDRHSPARSIFSMQCCGWNGGSTAGTGALVLGGIDHSHYTGSFMYTQITDHSCVACSRCGAHVARARRRVAAKLCGASYHAEPRVHLPTKALRACPWAGTIACG